MTIQLTTEQVCLLPMILGEAVTHYSERAASAPCEKLANYWASEAAKAAELKELLYRATALRVTTA